MDMRDVYGETETETFDYSDSENVVLGAGIDDTSEYQSLDWMDRRDKYAKYAALAIIATRCSSLIDVSFGMIDHETDVADNGWTLIAKYSKDTPGCNMRQGTHVRLARRAGATIVSGGPSSNGINTTSTHSIAFKESITREGISEFLDYFDRDTDNGDEFAQLLFEYQNRLSKFSGLQMFRPPHRNPIDANEMEDALAVAWMRKV